MIITNDNYITVSNCIIYVKVCEFIYTWGVYDIGIMA